ncbi:MAG: sigma-54-dependent transcriptional regulator [Vicinamibacterales bacterium]
MTERPHILIVDDTNPSLRDFVCACLAARGYETTGLDRPGEAVTRCRTDPPAAVILTLPVGGSVDSLDAVSAMHSMAPDMPVIVLSGQARTPAIVEAVRRGASDFISVPFDEVDLDRVLAKALHTRDTDRPPVVREPARDAVRPPLIGTSAAITRVREFVQRAAATDAIVLILGEIGTGKTIVAREIVAGSSRWDRPFVTVNCAASSAEMAGADLFGFAPNAFGAMRPEAGSPFETARGGTLFLDEIADMSPALQGRLLELLQDGDARPATGGEAPEDIRIIAATGRDIETAVAEGQFREDLYFRLNVISLRLPPLRERREDIPVLTRHFLATYTAQYGTPPTEIGAETMRRFLSYEWPGNVQELDNLIRRAVLLGSDSSLVSELGPMRPATPPPAPAPAAGEAATRGEGTLRERARSAAREAEHALIRQVLEQTHWNRKEAAAILGISYKALLNKIKDGDLQ